jgi:hypothetical protein
VIACALDHAWSKEIEYDVVVILVVKRGHHFPPKQRKASLKSQRRSAVSDRVGTCFVGCQHIQLGYIINIWHPIRKHDTRTLDDVGGCDIINYTKLKK